VRAGGQYYRTGAHSKRAGWVKDIGDAKIWTNISHARSMVTRQASETKAGSAVPELVEFHVTEVKVVDQTSRIQKAKLEKLEREAQRQIKLRKEALDAAQRAFDKAAANLKALKKD
jgi:hypothetical protein